MYFLILLGILASLTQLVHKPSEEFKIDLEYKFKPRPLHDNSSINLGETRKDRDLRISGGNPLPYLMVHLSLLQLGDQEIKIKCGDNLGRNRFSRKAEVNKPYVLDMGYTDDIKDRVVANEYTIILMSKEKNETSRIVLLIERDGTFLVNGIKRGKF